jgi:hypothetical protein
MSKKIYIFLKLIILSIVFNSYASSQVSINPMFLYMDKESKSATMDIINPTNEVMEFNLELKFGYPKYDSLGKWTLIYNDTIMESKFSLAPYLKIFPKKLIIPGKESQTVRFIIKNVPEDKDYALWTRVIASAEPVKDQIDSTYMQKDTNTIRAQIILKTNIVGLILYNSGNTTSSVNFNLGATKKDSNGLHLLIDFEKGGTAPFLGQYILKVYDNNDNLLINIKDKVAIYENSRVEFLLKSFQIIPGNLKVELTINNYKEGLPDEYRKSFTPVTKTFEIEY